MLSRYLRLLGRCTCIPFGQYLSISKLSGVRVGSHAASNGRTWHPIYRFKWIFVATAIGKLKLAQSVITVLLVPVAAVAFRNDKISRFDLSSIVFVAVFALVMLYIMSYGLRRIIGVISVDQKASVIRIGYLNFWGRRRNAIVPIADVIPLSDANIAPADFWAPVQRFSDKSFLLYLPLKKIEIVDEKIFYSIFGQF
ncbi:transmembrane protein 186 [Trichuris trichiura]|uniref:Transmembrane protein 186 n=1 Tax=Trichuris trichiura TaxID=36087 RepID=A0A077Z076_TRITR|nr:transmembrane protein 186 [Trichuris trichiura]